MKRGPKRKLAVEQEGKPGRPFKLSSRQQSQLRRLLLIRRRLTNKALAARFGIAEDTVSTYQVRLLTKRAGQGETKSHLGADRSAGFREDSRP
jgi:DNA-binding CsgD family transcriptional regulator